MVSTIGSNPIREGSIPSSSANFKAGLCAYIKYRDLWYDLDMNKWCVNPKSEGAVCDTVD